MLILSISVIEIHCLLLSVLAFALSKEENTGSFNILWFEGNIFNSPFGWRTMFYMFREFFCKIIEQSYFGVDFWVTHFVLCSIFPFTWVPQINKIHCKMILWSDDSDYTINLNNKSMKKHNERLRRKNLLFYGSILPIMFFAMFFLLLMPNVVKMPIFWKTRNMIELIMKYIII